jgi:hypothetical protein
VRAKLAAVHPAAWFAVVLVAGLAVLAWHRWVLDAPSDASWLDDDQPPLQASAMPELVPFRARQRTYPANLRLVESSRVGDC